MNMKNDKSLTKQQCHKISQLGLLRLTVPGKGFILFDQKVSKNNKSIEQDVDSYFISGIIYSLNEIKQKKYISDEQLTVGVNFCQKSNQNYSLIHIWKKQYEKYSEEIQVKIVRIQLYLQAMDQDVTQLILYLQKLGMWVILSMKLENTVKQYQKQLFQTIDLLSNFRPSLFIPGISIELQTLKESPLQTLIIWKRVIPPTIGSIIIRNFEHKNVFNLFMQRNSNPFNLQFITDETENVEGKALECLGIQ